MIPVPSKFQKFDLNAVDLNAAKSVNMYFWAYLQNKIAEYAEFAVEFRYDPTADQSKMFSAILEHEKIKAKVEILEELMGELMPPAEATAEQSDQQS